MDFGHSFSNGIDFVSGPSIDAAFSRVGAELVQLSWKRPGRAPVEVLWRSGVTDPPPDGWWRRHAPFLFPIVGGIHGNKSVTTEGDEVHFDGLHGFLRNSSMTLESAGPVDDGFSLVYSLRSDARTLGMYPWKFAVLVACTVTADGVRCGVTVSNLDARPMPYQVGWHPGINVPLAAGAKKDCRVRLPRGRVLRLLNDENCHLTGEAVEFDTAGDFDFNERELELTYMFDVSGVEPASRVVEIIDADGSPGVRVVFPDYPHLGVWSDAGAPFICVEPWQGMDDRVVQEPFDRKYGIVMLPPGASETRMAAVQVFEKQG